MTKMRNFDFENGSTVKFQSMQIAKFVRILSF